MASFHKEKTGYQHKFIRNDAAMLNQLFGTADVTPFWVADIDFEVAQPITDELKRLVDRGIYAYEFNSKAVFKSIASWHQRRHGINLEPESLVQVTGVLTGIAILIRELTAKGDKILVRQNTCPNSRVPPVCKSDRRGRPASTQESYASCRWPL